MSNYQIKALTPKSEVFIGWDPSMSTFFLHVIDTTKDEDDRDRDVLWIGCTPHEIYDIEDVIEAAIPHADVTDEIVTALYRDAHG